MYGIEMCHARKAQGFSGIGLSCKYYTRRQIFFLRVSLSGDTIRWAVISLRKGPTYRLGMTLSESKSPSPNKDGVGVVDEEVSTRVPSESSDIVVSGEVWVDLNSISESESRVLWESDCVSEGFGF